MEKDCPYATAVWHELRQPLPLDSFFSSSLLFWLQGNLGYEGRQQGNWSITFGVAIDTLWKARNDLVFNDQSMHSQVLICIIRNNVAGILKVKEMVALTKVPAAGVRIHNPIHWNPPPHGWVKLNCDGSQSEGEARATCGGILRDNARGFCLAFSCCLGDCPVLHAELWAILYGIWFAWSWGYHNILIEFDSLLAINLLNKGCTPRHPCYLLVQQITNLVGEAPNIKWSHVLQEANQVADRLAKRGLSLDFRYQIFDTLPSFLILPCLADRSLVSFPRGF